MDSDAWRSDSFRALRSVSKALHVAFFLCLSLSLALSPFSLLSCALVNVLDVLLVRVAGGRLGQGGGGKKEGWEGKCTGRWETEQKRKGRRAWRGLQRGGLHLLNLCVCMSVCVAVLVCSLGPIAIRSLRSISFSVRALPIQRKKLI